MKLHLFGAPRLEDDSGPVAFDTRKAFALLAFLALHEPQHRDVIGSLLWPDQDGMHARGALRRTLSAVKKSIPEDAIVATRDLVGLKPDAIWVDVNEFRARARVEDDDAALERAVSLYRDDFLTGFALRGTPEFDDWVAVERESLRRDMIRALARLATDRIDRGSPDDALDYLRRWLALDPLDETAHRTAIETYLAAGDRSAALRQYEECVRVLDEELAVAPLEETTALYESIRSGSGVRTSVRPSPVPEEAREIPFVGRASEARRMLQAIGDERTRLVAVEGEAGIGKSALLDLVVDQASLPHLEVRCHEEEGDQAFGAIARLLRAVVEESSTKAVAGLSTEAALEVSRLVPEVRSLHADLPEPPPLSDPGARTTFFEGIWDAVASLRSGHTTLVVIDDVHWLDDGSFESLAFGLRRDDLVAVKLALSWRTEEVEPTHRLRRFIADLERSTGVLHEVLPRLERHEVNELVAAAAPDADAALADTLFEESEGVPFFVVEYLRSQTATTDPTGGIEGFVRSQVARVSPVAHQVLTAASVLGRSTDLDLLRAVAGRNDDETVEAIEELTSRRMLLERPEGYDFAHEKVRQVVYGDTSLARLRLLHGRAHEHLLKTLTQRPETRALAAYHALRAGRDADAAEHYQLAGHHARELGANNEALMHLQNALALGHPDVGALHESIGDVHTLLGRYGDALSSYHSALARSDKTWRLEHKLGRLFVRRGEAASARGHLEAALEGAPEETPADRARIYADLALALRLDGDEDAARSAAEEALRNANEIGDPVATAQARNILGLLAYEPDEALAHLRASEAAAMSVADTGTRIAALNNIALVHRRLGEPEAAIAVAEQALELCVRRGDVHRQAALHNNLADALHEIGEEERSREHARAAAAMFSQVGEPGVMSPEIWKLVEW
jgi:DNA-binding SARP family transcriptional activator